MLGNLLMLFLPSPAPKVAAAVKPNPYAPHLVTQTRLAGSQLARGFRPSLSGTTGSEPGERAATGASSAGPIVQDVTSARRPAAWLQVGDPGADPADPVLTRDFQTGPAKMPISPYGSRLGVPHVIRSTMLEPAARPVSAADMAAARGGPPPHVTPSAHADALDAQWGDE